MEGGTGKQVLKMIHPLLFEDSEGSKVAFKRNSAGEIAYFHYNSPKSLDFVADAQRFNNKPPLMTFHKRVTIEVTLIIFML